jgi:hypothetical protein
MHGWQSESIDGPKADVIFRVVAVVTSPTTAGVAKCNLIVVVFVVVAVLVV